MSASETAARPSPLRWIANQPYLLLSITALCWAGNAVVGKLAAGHIPPVTLSFLRWFFAFLIVLPLSLGAPIWILNSVATVVLFLWTDLLTTMLASFTSAALRVQL